MPDILSQILSFSTIVFCLVIFALVWMQRRIIEITFPQVLTKKYWREFWIPAAPIGIGSLLAGLISSYPYPEMFKSTLSSRIFFGIFCGLISGHLYRLIKKNIIEKLGGTITPGPQDEDSNQI